MTDKRRRLHISLRLSMGLVLVLGILMGWQVNDARNQREAVAAVKKYGGWVHYDWELVNGKLAKGTQPHAPKWLRRFLGDEYFQEIAHVSLVYDDLTGRRYDIKNFAPADVVLARLVGVGKVKVLLLKGTQATDANLKYVGRLTSLEHLLIWDAGHVSDEGVGYLARLKNLESIHISNSRITDRNLSTLSRLPRLEMMSLQGNSFTDAGLASLGATTSLRRLCVGLGDNRITDVGLPHLVKLKNLEVLDLQRTSVTDKGLEKLKGLTKLREIWLSQSKTTEAGKRAFKKAMPNLKVIR